MQQGNVGADGAEVGTADLSAVGRETVPDSTAIHVPVMCERVIDLLSPALQHQGAVFVDCTLGLGGHTAAILGACPQARAIGIDRDPHALAEARRRLAPFGDRVAYVEAVYDELPEVLQTQGVGSVNAILLDLGLSSLQIDQRERGFAYSVDAPLDMRMDGKQELTAATVVNEYSYPQLVRILRRYGEEKFAERITRSILAAREIAPFDTSARLVVALSEAIPMAARKTGGHPAKRTFQALRIEVNNELQAVENVLPAAVDALACDGRLAVLAYHSLEDRIVKTTLAAGAKDRAPRNLPVVPPGLRPRLQLLTRGAEKPAEDECLTNPRAASARLRAARKLEEAA